MSVLQVLHIPDERLRKVAKPVEEVNAEIQRIVDDMFETMYAEEGIGLAATQVDIHQRIIVIDVSENLLSCQIYFSLSTLSTSC